MYARIEQGLMSACGRRWVLALAGMARSVQVPELYCAQEAVHLVMSPDNKHPAAIPTPILGSSGASSILSNQMSRYAPYRTQLCLGVVCG